MGIFGNLTQSLGALGGMIAPINPALGGALSLVGQVGGSIDPDTDPKVWIDPNPLAGEDLFARYRPLWGIPRGSKSFGRLATSGIHTTPQSLRFPERFSRIQWGPLRQVLKDLKRARQEHAADPAPNFDGIIGGHGLRVPSDIRERDLKPEAYKAWRARVIYSALASAQRDFDGRLSKPFPPDLPLGLGGILRDSSSFRNSQSTGRVKDWFDDHKSTKALLLDEWDRLNAAADELEALELEAWGVHRIHLENERVKAELVAQAAQQAAQEFEAKMAAIQAGTWQPPFISDVLPGPIFVDLQPVLPPGTVHGFALDGTPLITPGLKASPGDISPALAAGGLGLLLLLL